MVTATVGRSVCHREKKLNEKYLNNIGLFKRYLEKYIIGSCDNHSSCSEFSCTWISVRLSGARRALIRPHTTNAIYGFGGCVWKMDDLCLTTTLSAHSLREDDSDDHAVKTESLTEDENKDHADEDSFLLSVCSHTCITNDTNSETGSKRGETASETWGEVLVTLAISVSIIGGDYTRIRSLMISNSELASS